jgi:5-methyltetrahydropteroyltriglutamate--homocysteine methyltransferase
MDTAKLLGEIAEARALGIETRPVLIGPLTLLLLGKGVEGFDPFTLASPMIAAYKEVLAALAGQNVAWVQIDEPILATDLPKAAADFFRKAYAELAESPVKLMLTTYFDRLGDNLPLAVDANTAGIHIDLVRAPRQLDDVLVALKPQQILSLGCVEGRNIWLTDFAETRKLIASAAAKLGAERLIVAPSCSLLHVPHDLRGETKLPVRIKSWMRFAEEKLAEIVALANSDEAAYAANVAAIADRQAANPP